MNKYLKCIFISSKREFSYKFNILTLIFMNIFILLIQTNLWKSIYNENSHIYNISYSQIVLYLVIGTILRKILGSGIDRNISKDIIKGNIAIYLIRPQTIFLKYILEDLGRVLLYIFISVPFVMAYVWLNTIIINLYTLLLFFLSIIVSYILFILLSYIIGLLSVFLGNIVGLMMLKASLFSLLGAYFIPLDFYPSWSLYIINILPFKSIYYTPLYFLLHGVNTEAYINVLIQIVWCIIFLIIKFIVDKKIKKEIFIQGG